MNQPKWKAVAILLAVFSMGTVAGGAAVAAWDGERRIGVAQLGFGPRGDRPMLALVRRLGLSHEQRKTIERLMEEHAPRRRAIMLEMMSNCGQELEKEKSALDDQIRAVLTPDQRTQFDELSRRQRERFMGPSPQPHHRRMN